MENKIQLSNSEVLLRKTYFLFKPIIPRMLQIYLRRRHISSRKSFYRDIWPIDENASKPPDGWMGWPEGKQFALVLTHDVETEKGQENCTLLLQLEEELGFRSSFNFIARQYKVFRECQNYIKSKGFEVGLHGLYHNGNPFRSRKKFVKQAVEINRYLKEWEALGFRCPSMYHNLEWIGMLDLKYDSSTFDTDPFEPQPDGVGTIFPFWVRSESRRKGYLELPYTLPQDHTLFIIMREKTIDIWKQKLDWIAEKGGLALLITHPDYMNFVTSWEERLEYPADLYKEFLEYVRNRYAGKYWNILPRDLAHFWENKRERAQEMKSKARV